MAKLNVERDELVKIVGTLALEYGHTLPSILANFRNIFGYINRGIEIPTERREKYQNYLNFTIDFCAAIDDLTRGDITSESYKLEDSVIMVETIAERAWSIKSDPVQFSHEIQEGISNPNIPKGFYQIILYDLFKNSIQRGESKNINTKISMQDNLILTSIKDEGIGMSQEQLAGLQEKFVSYSPDGRGIGLTITKMFAELCGGSIDIQSEIGKGTTVNVSLPVYQK